MSNFRELRSQHRRISILVTLLGCPGYESNASIIVDALDSVGLPSTRDEVHTELAWLEEQGLITVESPLNVIKVATLTQRGAEVATGRTTVPGVKRPSPRT